MPSLDTVYVHADESCLGNQFRGRASPGAAAGLVEIFREGRRVARDFWASEPDTTNNRMAIMSAIVPLAALSRPCRVHFVSDSQYLVKGMSEWLPGWKRRNWTRKAGPIENLELWKELDRVAAVHQVSWHWVRGHDGHPRNEYANDLAVQAATEATSSGGLVDSGFDTWLEGQRAKGRYLGFDADGLPELP